MMVMNRQMCMFFRRRVLLSSAEKRASSGHARGNSSAITARNDMHSGAVITDRNTISRVQLPRVSAKIQRVFVIGDRRARYVYQTPVELQVHCC